MIFYDKKVSPALLNFMRFLEIWVKPYANTKPFNPKYALAYFALWADENQRFC
jgi:hypothetical protein